jgi:NitT/TauT family transport system permease protein
MMAMLPSRERLVGLAWFVGIFLALCAVWEATVKFWQIPLFILPPIEDVVRDFASTPSLYAAHAAFTVAASLAGFFCAIVAGVLIAVAVVSSRILERIFMTLLALIHSVPKVALAPLFVLWLGTGFEPKVAIAALMSILVIVVDLVTGMRSVDPEMVNLARVNRASAFAILFKIRFPHALPHFFGALKVAISLSVIGAIVGEYVGGQRGLGYMILVAQGSFDTPRAFAAVLLLSVIATALFYLVVYLEARLLPWHVSQRSANPP